MLDIYVIRPSQSDLYSSMMMISKRAGPWHMHLDHKDLNKITIDYKFHIPIIDELLDEL